ncbi:MAG TPA: hypothetical protein VGN14_18960 [Candidatus Elarobacter sp.]|jgi:glycosyltransferase involved in cell wall biosynthesis
MSLVLGRDVLLFFEDRDRDTFVRGDRRMRRRLRKAVAPFRPGKQSVTGFEMSFTYLCLALRHVGQIVHVNDYRLARQNPTYPVGICGYTHVLDDWTLPNPALLGPGLFDHPKQRPDLLDDERFRYYLIRCDWMRDMFAAVYDEQKLRYWFAGIDLEPWPDTSGFSKDVDVLVYDKIRWDRETLVPAFLEPMLAELRRRSLRYEVVRYTRYTQAEYAKLLGRSRSLLFLCESETQGRAYQEALASNVPVLAWDPGLWLDPNRVQWESEPVKAESVPYFSAECGERFRDLGAFTPALDRFWERLGRYTPRRYVAAKLSLEESARVYLNGYFATSVRAAAEPPAAGAPRELVAHVPAER